MSYPAAPAEPTQRHSATPAKKPGTLNAAIITAIITGLASIGNGLIILIGGLDLIKSMLADVAGVPVSEITDERLEGIAELGGTSVNQLQSTINTRAYLALGVGVVVLLLGLAMNKAATWARVLLTITAVVAIFPAIIIAGDGGTDMMAVLSLVVLLGAIVAIVLTWLPPNNRYSKAVKNA